MFKEWCLGPRSNAGTVMYMRTCFISLLKEIVGNWLDGVKPIKVIFN